MNSQALLPAFFRTQSSSLSRQLLGAFVGALFIGLLAQISIRLPWTPVPITGQTFGVLLVGFLWGGQLSFLALTTYVGAGALGLPWFAAAQSGFTGASSGYLAGMILAGGLVGLLSDRGWGRTWVKAITAGLLGELVIFACGLAVLSFFVPSAALFHAGLYPFLPGAMVKLIMAVSLSVSTHQLWSSSPAKKST